MPGHARNLFTRRFRLDLEYLEARSLPNGRSALADLATVAQDPVAGQIRQDDASCGLGRDDHCGESSSAGVEYQGEGNEHAGREREDRFEVAEREQNELRVIEDHERWEGDDAYQAGNRSGIRNEPGNDPDREDDGGLAEFQPNALVEVSVIPEDGVFFGPFIESNGDGGDAGDQPPTRVEPTGPDRMPPREPIAHDGFLLAEAAALHLLNGSDSETGSPSAPDTQAMPSTSETSASPAEAVASADGEHFQTAAESPDGSILVTGGATIKLPPDTVSAEHTVEDADSPATVSDAEKQIVSDQDAQRFVPIPAELLEQIVERDLHALETALQAYFAQVGAWGEDVLAFIADMGWSPWAAGAAAVYTGVELSRSRRRKRLGAVQYDPLAWFPELGLDTGC